MRKLGLFFSLAGLVLFSPLASSQSCDEAIVLTPGTPRAIRSQLQANGTAFLRANTVDGITRVDRLLVSFGGAR